MDCVSVAMRNCQYLSSIFFCLPTPTNFPIQTQKIEELYIICNSGHEQATCVSYKKKCPGKSSIVMRFQTGSVFDPRHSRRILFIYLFIITASMTNCSIEQYIHKGLSFVFNLLNIKFFRCRCLNFIHLPVDKMSIILRIGR